MDLLKPPEREQSPSYFCSIWICFFLVPQTRSFLREGFRFSILTVGMKSSNYFLWCYSNMSILKVLKSGTQQIFLFYSDIFSNSSISDKLPNKIPSCRRNRNWWLYNRLKIQQNSYLWQFKKKKKRPRFSQLLFKMSLKQIWEQPEEEAKLQNVLEELTGRLSVMGAD